MQKGTNERKLQPRCRNCHASRPQCSLVIRQDEEEEIGRQGHTEGLWSSHTYHAMKFTPLVPLRSAVDMMFACAILAEVLCSFWDGVGKEVHFDPAQ